MEKTKHKIQKPMQERNSMVWMIFNCKGCGKNIRIQGGKGEVEVTCPLCGNKTIYRT